MKVMRRRKEILNLTKSDFSILFGTSEKKIINYAGQFLKFDFHYRRLDDRERDNIILKVLKRIESGDLTIAGKHRRPEWERGWEENLAEFIESGHDVHKLTPKYFKTKVPVRLYRDYAMPLGKNFETNLIEVFRNWLFREYFGEVDAIYEFGCGPASHLALLANLFPRKKLYGFDWTKSSQKIIHILAKHYKWPMQGGYFDFFNPDKNIEIEPNSAVFTFGALEQVGKNHEPFLRFLLEKSPEICINVEGLYELYDPNCLMDYLAIKYHKCRNYLQGLLTRLQELEKEEKIKIIKVHRQLFGNLFDDPHSYIIWKPRGKKKRS
jgi:hypothetical protein